MIRIIGGRWNGRKLHAPHGRDTRPTPSRVRESLFDILGVAIEDRPFLDLYAGSGAVGLDALSRGASRAVFVETSRGALAALRQNISDLQCEEQTLVIPKPLPGALGAPALSALDQGDPPVVFLDPPYGRQMAQKTLTALAALTGPAWERSACAVQTEKDLSLPELAGRYRLSRRYVYGDNSLWLYETE